MISYKNISDYRLEEFAIHKKIGDYLSAYPYYYPKFDTFGYNYARYPYGYRALEAFSEYFKNISIIKRKEIRLLHELSVHAQITLKSIESLKLDDLLALAKEYVAVCKQLKNKAIKDQICNKCSTDYNAKLLHILELDKKIYTGMYRSFSNDEVATAQGVWDW